MLNLYHNGNEGMAWHSDAEKDLKKNGAMSYYPRAIYMYYINPYLIDNFREAIISSAKFTVLYIFITENDVFFRIMDKLILKLINFGKFVTKMVKSK